MYGTFALQLGVCVTQPSLYTLNMLHIQYYFAEMRDCLLGNVHDVILRAQGILSLKRFTMGCGMKK